MVLTILSSACLVSVAAADQCNDTSLKIEKIADLICFITLLFKSVIILEQEEMIWELLSRPYQPSTYQSAHRARNAIGLELSNIISNRSTLIGNRIFNRLAQLRVEDPSFDLRSHPAQYLCPINLTPIQYPVLAIERSGYQAHYELDAINQYYNYNRAVIFRSPTTRQPITEIRAASKQYKRAYLSYLSPRGPG